MAWFMRMHDQGGVIMTLDFETVIRAREREARASGEKNGWNEVI